MVSDKIRAHCAHSKTADVAAKISCTVANSCANRRNCGRVDALNRHSEKSDSAPIPQRVGTVCDLTFSVSYLCCSDCIITFQYPLSNYIICLVSLGCHCWIVVLVILFPLLCVHLLYMRFLEQQILLEIGTWTTQSNYKFTTKNNTPLCQQHNKQITINSNDGAKAIKWRRQTNRRHVCLLQVIKKTHQNA